MKIWSGLGNLSFEWAKNTPLWKWKFGQDLALWGFEWAKNTPTPWKWKFGQVLALWVLNGQEYPPPSLKMNIWSGLATLSFEWPRILPPLPENENLVRTWHPTDTFSFFMYRYIHLQAPDCTDTLSMDIAPLSALGSITPVSNMTLSEPNGTVTDTSLHPSVSESKSISMKKCYSVAGVMLPIWLKIRREWIKILFKSLRKQALLISHLLKMYVWLQRDSWRR